VKNSEINDLLNQLDSLLAGFDPFSFTYIDFQGNWSKNPFTLRDRISNELWFRIWKMRFSPEFNQKIKKLILPFIQDNKSLKITHKIIQGISDKKNKTDKTFLMIFNLLSRLIEYEILKRNSETYIPGWDDKGKIKRKSSIKKARIFRNSIVEQLQSEDEVKILDGIIDLLRGEKSGIFNRVSLITAEEENVRNDINDLFSQARNFLKESEVFDLINEQLNINSETMSNAPEAFLRPCIELLTNPVIPISSGIQYKSSIILGMLKDTRCANSLLQLLKKLDFRHTHLRCNIIYALGNLRYPDALDYFTSILNAPDSTRITLPDGSTPYNQPLHAEKCEVIWALGKLGIHAIKAVSELKKYNSHVNKELRTWLAWSMGMIGKEQKEKTNGIEADTVITLLNLLTTEDKNIFEEVSSALKNIGLPNFLHSLYLHNIETIPILALKPSKIGFYELSETILYLTSIKKPVVIAVNGDSGTGKTFFCETIINGFGDIQNSEIVYLQRDNAIHTRIFNRMLGIKWLREHIDPRYYDDYPLGEDEDNPDEVFNEFIKKHKDKKIIILDGWRDTEYFHQIIKKFYEKGYLDIIVSFRTNSSTRRLNLEEREGSYENVKLCLANVEKTMIEETRFYREGTVLIYNLDNSISSRLDGKEISEVFRNKKVDSWNNYFRIGRFEKFNKPLRIKEGQLQQRFKNFSFKINKISPVEITRFTPDETKFHRTVNNHIDEEPNLLEEIKVGDYNVNHIAFYIQGQIAFCDYDGNVGILTGFNNRIFSTKAHDNKIIGLDIIKRDICTIDSEGKLKIISFYKNTITTLGKNNSPPCSIVSYPDGKIVTGHLNGTIKLWDIQSKLVKIFNKHHRTISALCVDYQGRIISADNDNRLCIWDLENKKVKVISGHEAPITVLGLYPDGRIVTGTGLSSDPEADNNLNNIQFRIIDFNTGSFKSFDIKRKVCVKSLNIYFDGRIIAGLKAPHKSKNNLIIIDPRRGHCIYTVLKGHVSETRNCITMGPRIITCGGNGKSGSTLRIWGTEVYTKAEVGKLTLMEDTMEKPPYYRSLF